MIYNSNNNRLYDYYVICIIFFDETLTLYLIRRGYKSVATRASVESIFICDHKEYGIMDCVNDSCKHSLRA